MFSQLGVLIVVILAVPILVVIAVWPPVRASVSLAWIVNDAGRMAQVMNAETVTETLNEAAGMSRWCWLARPMISCSLVIPDALDRPLITAR